jgi:methyl-accepting chemotaxis protein
MNLSSIRVRLLLLFSALALGMAWYLFANVSGEIGKLREGARIAAVSEVAVASSALVHELQKERGFSAGFIGSQGTKFRDELEKQRKDTDARRKSLSELFAARAGDLPPAIAERMRKASEEVGRIDERRSRISALGLTGPESFGFFTGAIDNYLAAVGEVVPTLSDAGMMRGFSSYVMFLGAKEQAGRERATVNAALAADKPLDAALMRRLIGILTSQDNYLASFRASATPEQKAALDSLLAAKASQDTAAMRKQVLDKAAEGGFGIAPPLWFSTITTKIEAMKGFEALSQSSSEQAASVEETTASIEQMTRLDHQNTENAKVTDGMATKPPGRPSRAATAVEGNRRSHEVHRRQDRHHRRHRLPDQPAGAERRDRSRARRRARQGLRRRRRRSRKLAERSQVAAQEIGSSPGSR